MLPFSASLTQFSASADVQTFAVPSLAVKASLPYQNLLTGDVPRQMFMVFTSLQTREDRKEKLHVCVQRIEKNPLNSEQIWKSLDICRKTLYN